MSTQASSKQASVRMSRAVASPRGLDNGLRVSIRDDKPAPWLSLAGWNFQEKKVLTVGFATDKLFWQNLQAICKDVLGEL